MNTILIESMILILKSKTYFEPSCEGSLLHCINKVTKGIK